MVVQEAGLINLLLAVIACLLSVNVGFQAIFVNKIFSLQKTIIQIKTLCKKCKNLVV